MSMAACRRLPAAAAAAAALLCVSLAGAARPDPDSLSLPLTLNTWSGDFRGATSTAFAVLARSPTGDEEGPARLDALVEGLSYCEAHQCGGSVGFGGHPDSSGEPTLDALIFDGVTHDVGAVGGLRRVKNAIVVARGVLEHTNHSLLVGDAATRFAVDFLGFPEEPLGTPESDAMHAEWQANACQPNFYRNFPNCTTSCPPYALDDADGYGQGQPRRQRRPVAPRFSPHVHERNHDTIGMVVIDAQGDLACGVTTNGLGNKVPGRVGDSPLPGAGCYVDNDVGGCACTGDGDVMLRFSPSSHAVQYMLHGASPQAAAEKAIRKIARYYPGFVGGMVCADKAGNYGAAGWNWVLSFSVQNPRMEDVESHDVPPLNGLHTRPLSPVAAAIAQEHEALSRAS